MLDMWLWSPVIAHRCGGALAPENTLAGLGIAAALGVGCVEFDVMLSRDARPVVIHDDTVERTAGTAGRVCELDAAQLARVDVGRRHHAAFAGEIVPELAAVAARCRQLGLAANVEIKCEDADGERTGAVVAAEAARLWAGAPLPPLISSFSEVALRAARLHAPALPRALLVGAIPEDWRARLGALDCVALHADVRGWTIERVRAVREQGVWLAGYTENDPVRAGRWLAAGASALFTDRPDLLLPLLAGTSEAGRPSPP